MTQVLYGPTSRISPQLRTPTATQGNLPEAEPCGLQAPSKLEDKLGLLKWMLFLNYTPECRKSPCNNHRKLKLTSGEQPHSLAKLDKEEKQPLSHAMLMCNARKSLCRCVKNAFDAFLGDAALVRPHSTTKEQSLEMPIILLPADLCYREPRSKGGRWWRAHLMAM